MGFIRVVDAESRQFIRLNVDSIESYYTDSYGGCVGTKIRTNSNTAYYVLESPESIDELIKKGKLND